MITSKWAAAIAFAAASFLSPGARAEVLAVATVDGSFTHTISNSVWTALPVATQTFALPFTTAADNERIVITYSTTCLALGFIINVRANVDGQFASPGRQLGVPLCNNTVSGSSYPATRVFSIVVPRKGRHTVAIEAKGNGAAVRIGDSALVVQH